MRSFVSSFSQQQYPAAPTYYHRFCIAVATMASTGGDKREERTLRSFVEDAVLDYSVDENVLKVGPQAKLLQASSRWNMKNDDKMATWVSRCRCSATALMGVLYATTIYFTLQFTLLVGVVCDRLTAAGADVELPRTPFGCRDSKDYAIVVAMEHWKELPAFVCCSARLYVVSFNLLCLCF